ncbi:NAD(P)/FAD-dependent oxidoreductase [Aspergillus foveolatus]|uniref:NAD(P)/FAD-dependent oxidoreductase n=1 Tax=Aspergillus foveolatus TaxID=210207 RepID=UPI003CCE30D1
MKVTIVDRAFERFTGSTGCAPGFVGQFNESEVLTRLAIDSVGEYLKIPGGFDPVGGLEVATSEAGVEKLQWRLEAAKEQGLKAEIISPEQAAELAPDIIKPDNVLALHFPVDGTADGETIAAYFQSGPRTRGIEFLEAEVTKICRSNEIEGAVTTKNRRP